MKIFWGFIGLLAVLTAGLLLSGRPDGETSSDSEPVALADPAGEDAPGAAEATTGAAEEPAVDPEPAPPEADLEATPAETDRQTDRNPANVQPLPAETQTPGGVLAGAQDESPAAGEADDGTLKPNAPAEISRLEAQIDEHEEAELEALANELQQAANAESEEVTAPSAGRPEPAGDSPEASADTSEETAPAPVEVEQASESAEARDGAAGTGASKAEPGEASPIGEQVKPAPQADPTKPEIVPSTFEKREDGSILADKRFVIRGQGTKESPYVVTWDMLVSANELYDPRRGKLKLPERIKMLDGNYVKVVGYVTFPIVAEGPNEMLAMLNAWDGCCIGVPPTPYDAVEVRLAQAASAEQMLMSWGSVTGKFKVEPYLAADWLLGLYLMEDAVLKAESM